ncbi:MAG TPA: class I SAM-dependent methyltransferase [Bacteroidia bacterium]|nr:class I SAM-dependent methyltransferase [Bacteroidia bacterium]
MTSSMLLGERYRNDKQVFRRLSSFQEEMIRSIEAKIEQGVYRFEKVPCDICGSTDFISISEKDRYGLYMPVGVCIGCGLVQTNPRMTQESYNQFYNYEYRKLYNASDRPTHEWIMNQRRSGEWIFKYIEESRLLKGKKYSELLVLEIGCGSGGILMYFKEKGFRTKGIDLGEEYLKFGAENYGLDLETNTLENLRLETKADIIIYSHVLEHILSPSRELQTLKRFIHNDSLIYIEVPGVKIMMNSYKNDFISYLQNAHVYHYTLTSLKNLFDKNGYQLIRGTEQIKSLFKPGNTANVRFINDRNNVLRYLKRVEFVRKNIPFVPYEIKNKMLNLFLRSIKALGIYTLVRSAYLAVRKKQGRPKFR